MSKKPAIPSASSIMVPSWTSSLKEMSYKLFYDRKEYNFKIFKIPTNTDLYKGGTNLWRSLNGSSSPRFPFSEAKNRLAWFGDKYVAEVYGPAVKFTTNQEFSVINVGSPETIKTLMKIAEEKGKDEVIKALKEVFPIHIEKLGNGGISEEVGRQSEPKEDKIVAQFFCEVFDCKKLGIKGWAHLQLSGFSPEVMLCCPYQVLDPQNFGAVPYSEERKNTLIANDKAYQREQLEGRRRQSREQAQARRLPLGLGPPRRGSLF